jgi:hypothetical protein
VVVQHHPQGRHQRTVVLQRLAHAHHHHVGDDPLAGRQLQPLAQPVLGKPQLGQDLAGAQVAAEALVAGGAEAAAHGATGLGGHAQRAAVVLGDEHGLDGVAAAHVEQPLGGAVGRDLLGQHRQARISARPASFSRRDLARSVMDEVLRALLVNPAEELGGAKALLAQPRSTHSGHPGRGRAD